MYPWIDLNKKISDFKRFQEILLVLTRHGFGFIIDRFHFRKYLPKKIKLTVKKQKLSTPERLRITLEELGPTFIKLGQLLSTRPDILPEEFLSELTKLQDRVPPFTKDKADQLLQKQLGKPLNKFFKHFEKEPIAAASISQVHKATTLKGEPVVVKIQRPGLKKIISTDIEILRFLAKTLEKINIEKFPQKPIDLVEEFENLMLEELDFKREAQHLVRFRNNFVKKYSCYFPKVYWNLSNTTYLTIEYIKGKKIPDFIQKAPATLKSKIANTFFDVYIKMVLADKFFHADAHAGNFLIDKENRLVFIDAGQVGRLDQETVNSFTDMLLALINNDTDTLVDAYLRLGMADESIKLRLLKKDISIFLEQYYDMEIAQISFGQALQDLVRLSLKHKFKLPSDFIILAKTFLGVEGLARKLDPKLNLIKVAGPKAEKIIAQRYSPHNLSKEFFRRLKELERFLGAFPRQLHEIMLKLQHGKLKIEFEHKGLEKLQRNLERASNRFSSSVIVGSLIMASSFLIVSRIGPLWKDFSILGLIGFLLAGVLGIWIIIAILRSGRM